MPKLSREFSFGWIPVESSQQGKTHVGDMRFFRRDLETGREISNEFIHGANYEKEAGKKIVTRTN